MSCQKCGAKTQLNLCGNCQNDLHDMITGLHQGQPLANGRHEPGWLEYLQDAAHGSTRLGRSERRSGDHTAPLPCNLTASQLLKDANETLSRWADIINPPAS